MKRITACILCLLMLACSLGYASEESNANTYSEYELVRLFNEVSKMVPEIVRVPAGIYTVGKDLPAGVYTVLKNSQVSQNTDNDYSHVAVFSSMDEYNKDPDNLFNDDSHALIACNTYWSGFSYDLTDGMILCVKMGKAGLTKHSKNLFAAFWNTEDEQSVTVDLSTIIESGRSGEISSNTEENEKSHLFIESSDDWTVTRKYEYNNKYGYYCFVIFKHSFPIDQKTNVTFTFYDNNSSIIDQATDYVGCTGSNYEYIASGRSKIEYKYAVATITSSDLSRTTDCMDGMKVSSSRDDLKIIVTAENTGDKPVSSCKLDILYFDENKNVIDSSSTYLRISDSEMQKGEIITHEVNKYGGAFDSYELFYNACNYGNK